MYVVGLCGQKYVSLEGVRLTVMCADKNVCGEECVWGVGKNDYVRTCWVAMCVVGICGQQSVWVKRARVANMYQCMKRIY